MGENEQKRGRGRPKGSKNKPKPITAERISSATLEEAYPDRRKNKKVGKTLTKATGTSINSMEWLEELNSKDDNGSNAKIAQFLMQCRAISKYADVKNIETLYACFEAYLKLCYEFDFRITNMTAYMACGLSRKNIDDWANKKRRSSDPAYKEFADTLREMCSAAREQYGVEGKTNPVLTIFHQKAYDKFNDQPIQESDDVSPLGEMQDAHALAKKYENIPLD